MNTHSIATKNNVLCGDPKVFRVLKDLKVFKVGRSQLTIGQDI